MFKPRFYQSIGSEPGYHINMLRIQKGMSVSALAKATGVHRQTITKIEANAYCWDKMPMGILITLYSYFGQRLVVSFEPADKDMIYE